MLNLSNTLTHWYHIHKRDLPWRNISDPYLIWISEIILQQTRVNQGISYYFRFIERFPNVTELSDAEEDEVLKYWQGLGYYSRARNLHKAAQQIQIKFNGVFPTNYNEILQLIGIGEYTAAAISSFAFQQPYAVVDGNVYRVLSRFYGIEKPIDSTSGKKEFAKIAQKMLDKNDPATHNQAIMEFGALQCIPSSPDCEFCPLNGDCQAFKHDKIQLLPVKSKKTKTTNRYFNYLFIKFGDQTFLQKRSSKDIWQNLYEFPLIESDELLQVSEISENSSFRELFKGIHQVNILNTTNPMKHILSHRVIYAQFITIEINELNSEFEKLTTVSLNELGLFAISRLTELFLEKTDF